ncbi:ABC transporter substrate-binding protein [Denitromonas sp.]|uniref:ABC transporter substrate-binding protein n=1 Tax=Denitromonas sp. TaxID=2734609 RepID=UPI003A8B8A1E
MKRSGARLLRAVAMLLCCMAGPLMASPSVYLVLSGDADAYMRTASTIAYTLQANLPGVPTIRADVDGFDAHTPAPDDLVVTIGTRAAQEISRRATGARLICTLLTEQSYNDLPATEQSQRTAVFIDQPAARQLALIRTALPDWSRVAIVHGSNSSDFIRAINAAAPAMALKVRTAEVTDDQTLYSALQSVLATPSVLLAVPDPKVFNNFTIQNVLLTAYRHRSPVIGFSPAYVRAGAIMAVYSTPEQMGQQAAELAALALSGQALPNAGYPSQFSVSINPHVARSLSIDLPDAATLEARIRRQEQRQ